MSQNGGPLHEGVRRLPSILVHGRRCIWQYVDYQVATANSEVEFDCRRETEQLMLLLMKYLVCFMFKGASRLPHFNYLDNKERIEKILKEGI